MRALESNSIGISRRELFRMAGAAAMTSGLARTGLGLENEPPAAGAFRIAHLTDIHVQPELKAEEGFRKCLAAVHDLKPRPDLILTGGDLVFDVLAAGHDRARELFDLYTRICKDSDIPIRNCVGNHDVLGWGAKRIATSDPLYGKKMVQERLDLARTTYSFDHKGWHICMVDDILPKDNQEEGYEAGISEVDLGWLKADLQAAGGRPTLMVTHIPFISVVVFRGVDATTQPATTVPRAGVCRNPKPILELLRDHRVKLVLAGHLHDNEIIRYEHTTHVGEGAVSGAWWKGPHRLSPEGFGVIDLRPDGTFEHAYHTYGWKAEPAG